VALAKMGVVNHPLDRSRVAEPPHGDIETLKIHFGHILNYPQLMYMELLASEFFHYHSGDIETLKIHHLSQLMPFQESLHMKPTQNLVDIGFLRQLKNTISSVKKNLYT
jgi:hypothetical protein